MKILFSLVCLLVVSLFGVAVDSSAASGVVNFVKPVVPPPAVDAIDDGEDELLCENGLVLQKNGRCCPQGTTNDLWPGVCTPVGTIEDQLFNEDDATYYCPGADMFIVSDRNRKWFSCADRDSVPMYPAAQQSEGGKFCRDHGYGYLIRIRPWGVAGCVQVGDSQGDGCIEAGTCSFGGK